MNFKLGLVFCLINKKNSMRNSNKNDLFLENKTFNSKNKKNNIFSFIWKHATIFALLLGLFSVYAMYLWKDNQSKKDIIFIQKEVSEQVDKNRRELLMYMIKPLVWSIRTEIMRGNLEQVNYLISDFVKEKNLLYIHVIEPNGNVLLSTNKKLETNIIGGEIDTSLLRIQKPFIEAYVNDIFVVAAPVMGVDRRIATVVFGYKPDLIIMEKEK